MVREIHNSGAIWSEEYERQLLGILIQDSELIDEAAVTLRGEEFYDLRHTKLYELLCGMRERQVPVTMPTVLEEAKSLEGGRLAVGDAPYVFDMVNKAAAPAYDLAVKTIKKKAQIRKYQAAAHQILQTINDDGDDDSRLSAVGSHLTPLLHDTETGGEATTKDIVREALGQIEQAFAHKGQCTGVPTGFAALDKITGGLQAGDMIVLAARPSMGKTALALNIADYAAFDKGIPVGFLSLEMTSASLMKRIFSSRANIDGHKLMTGNLSRSELGNLVTVAGEASKAPLFINDKSGLNIMEMSAICRRMVLKDGVKLLCIDYLQLLQAAAESRVQEVSRISSAIKSVAKELGVPVLVLSQLSRLADGDRPRLSHLRDSGSIEQDADVVMLLSREEGSSLTNLDVAKHRTGPTAIAELQWDATLTKYTNPHYFTTNDAQADAA